MRGTGGPYLRGSTWWLRFSVGGRKLRVSTGLQGGEPGKPPAAVLRAWADKLAELGRGNLAALDRGVTWEDLEDALLTYYRAQGRSASLRNADLRLRPWRRVFSGRKAAEITEEAIRAHAVRRRDLEGAAVATVNLEIRLIRRAYRLLRRRLPYPPEVRQLPGARIRQGTVPGDILRSLEARLPPWAAAPVRFLRLTGWRTAEACGLEWRHVDWSTHLLRLETSKTGEPRLYPFRRYRPLRALLRLQRLRQRSAGRVAPWVFPGPSGGRLATAALRGAWTRAARAEGYPGGLHDLRRTRVQEQDAGGMPVSVGMSLVGIKSVATYRRYAVVSIADQEEWLARLEESPPETGRLLRFQTRP